MDRITEIQARLAEINNEIDGVEGEAFTALENESRSLLEELKGLQETAQARQELRQKIAAGAGATAAKQTGKTSAEQRAADDFRNTSRMTIDAEQSRSVLISSGTLAQPTKVDGINDIPGAKVSTLVSIDQRIIQ